MPIGDSDDDLQFTKVELDQPNDGDLHCSQLGTAITDEYYLVNGQVISPEAKAGIAEASGVTSGGTSRFSKAVLYGAIAAGLGSSLYFLVSWLTGYEIGLISIVVGIMVGKAVFVGSGNRGGRKFQVLAVMLTYFSIVGSYLPLMIMQFNEEQTEQSATASGDGGAASAAENVTEPSGGEAISAAADPEEQGESGLLGIVFLVGLLFALPFLSGLDNLLGLAIIAFGLWEGWKRAALSEFVIEGPFTIHPTLSQETP
jgi:hypothetical protein